MDTRKVYCVLYILLLTMTTPALCVQQQVEEKLLAQQEPNHDSQVRERRSVAVGPLALYAGVAVSPWVWVALVAAYGLSMVLRYGVRRTNSDSHSCANNRGWCRPSCFSHEYIDWLNSAVCGGYNCCRPGNL
ncbi:big defensin-like [Mercenaria mercenaria]|uniref:big defensin-like n=1 Tax=Mercenaria mercenaria TaxID=6596 RepID=UPI00234E6A0D|nr:big defensin-like [Mercenaria mercenaria]